jgi:hypothetical protein
MFAKWQISFVVAVFRISWARKMLETNSHEKRECEAFSGPLGGGREGEGMSALVFD